MALGAILWQHYAAQRWQNLLDGTAICFQRVEQSYTARMLGHQGGAYLQHAFLKRTQACWTDLIAASGSLGQEIVPPSYQGLLQNLAGDVHAFQEKLQSNGDGTFIRQEIHQKFHKLDVLKNELSDTLAAHLAQTTKWWYASWFVLVVAGGLFLHGLGYRWWERRKEQKIWQKLELDAEEELKNGFPWPVLKIDRLVQQVLQVLPLPRLRNLWQQFFAAWAAGKIDVRQCTAPRIALPAPDLDRYEALPAANQFEGNIAINEQVKQLTAALPDIADRAALYPPLRPWPRKTIPETFADQGIRLTDGAEQEAMNQPNNNLVNIHELLLKMLGKLTPRFFGQGVRLKFAEMAEGFYQGSAEEVAQFLYSVLDYALAACADVDLTHKILEIASEELAVPPSVRVRFAGLNLKFKLPSVLNSTSSAYDAGTKAMLIFEAIGRDLGLTVTWAFATHTTLQITFPAVADLGGEVSSGTAKRLSRMVRGKKKDVLAQLDV